MSWVFVVGYLLGLNFVLYHIYVMRRDRRRKNELQPIHDRDRDHELS